MKSKDLLVKERYEAYERDRIDFEENGTYGVPQVETAGKFLKKWGLGLDRDKPIVWNGKSGPRLIHCLNNNKTYWGTYSAARILGLTQSAVHHVLSGKIKSTKGYRFEYVEVDVDLSDLVEPIKPLQKESKRMSSSLRIVDDKVILSKDKAIPILDFKPFNGSELKHSPSYPYEQIRSSFTRQPLATYYIWTANDVLYYLGPKDHAKLKRIRNEAWVVYKNEGWGAASLEAPKGAAGTPQPTPKLNQTEDVQVRVAEAWVIEKYPDLAGQVDALRGANKKLKACRDERPSVFKNGSGNIVAKSDCIHIMLTMAEAERFVKQCPYIVSALEKILKTPSKGK